MLETARFSKRVFSYLFDLIIALLFGAALGYVLFTFTEIPWYFSVLLSLLNSYIAFILINVLLMCITHGRTLGALIYGIKIVRKDGSSIGFKIALIKSLYIGLVPFVLANAIFMLVVHTEQTLFDRITDTVVIDTRK